MKPTTNFDDAIPVSWASVSSFRLERHHLANRASVNSIEKVVGDTGGIQAQLMSTAQMALWARINDLKRDDVVKALWQDRSLIKIWAMRSTVHLVPSKDLPMYIAALKRSGKRIAMKWYKRHSFTDEEIQHMVHKINDGLADGPLTRRELAGKIGANFGAKGIEWITHGWGGAIKQACIEGMVCFGPNRKQETTFVNCSQWLPKQSSLSQDKAELMLLKRYLHSYGPANPHDYATWSGLLVKEIMPIWEKLENHLSKVSINRQTAWILSEDIKPLTSGTKQNNFVNLIPSFDTYMLGHKDKSHLITQSHYKAVYRKAGWLSPVILVNGRVTGVWRHKRKGKRLNIEVQPFKKLPKFVREGISREAHDLGQFLDAESTISYL
jgi:hypothetical protein